MIPNRQITINTSPVQSLHIASDQHGNISYWNAVARSWVPVTDQSSIDSIVRALPADHRAPAAQPQMAMPPPPRPQMPALTRGLSSWETTNMERAIAESQATGLESINRDRAGQSPDSAGYQLAGYLLSNNLTYNLAGPRFGMSGREIQYAVKYGIVKSEYDKRTLEQYGLSGFTVNRSLGQ